MKYTEFCMVVKETLKANPAGLTWEELKRKAKLPYQRPCPEWVAWMEKEIGLCREKEKRARAFVWKVRDEY